MLSPATRAASTVGFFFPEYLISPGANTYLAMEGFPDITVVSIRRSGDLASTVGVDVVTSADTALPGVDYVEVATNLVFRAGETEKAVWIPLLNDGLAERVKRFRVTLANPTGGAVLGTPAVATVRLTDSDQDLHVELPAYSIREDAGALTLRVLRLGDADHPVTVDYATVPVSATPGEDYVATSGTLQFPPGTTLQPVVVPILNNELRGASRTFRISLSNPSAGEVLGTPASAIVTITDTDEVIQFQADSLTVLEGAALVHVAVTRGENCSTAAVDAVTTYMSALAGKDYQAVTNRITFAPGERLRFTDIPLLNDGLREGVETFRLMLRNPTGGAVLGTNRMLTISILDNDPGIGFQRGNESVRQGQARLDLPVVRGNDEWLGPFSVNYHTADVSAQAGVDYVATSGTLDFGPGENVKTIPVVLLGNVSARTTKSLRVVLSHPTGPIPLGRDTVTISLAASSAPRTAWVHPPVKADAFDSDGYVQLAWRGSAAVWRADSITGPWEELGTMDGPLVLPCRAARGFYQLRSPRSGWLYVPSS